MLASCMALIDEPSDKEKFEEIYIRYKDMMYETAVSIIKNETEAEDIVQDSFFKIAKHISRFSEIDQKKTASFIFIIVRNTAFDYLRKEKRLDAVPYEDVDTPDKIIMPEFERVISESGMGYVMDHIKSMDKIYTDAMNLRYIYGFTISEIAQLLGITPNNAEMRIYRARLMLREKLEGNGHEVK